MSHIKNSVDELIETARRMQFAGDDEKYDSVDLDDQGLRLKLMRTAALRNPTIADLDKALKEIDHERRESVLRTMEFCRGCDERRDDLRVFYVINTANRSLTVLAKDAACARYFALFKGHIQDKANGKVMVMKEENERALRSSGKALGRALKDGYPGVVTMVGQHVVNEHSQKVYTPMTAVE